MVGLYLAAPLLVLIIEVILVDQEIEIQGHPNLSAVQSQAVSHHTGTRVGVPLLARLLVPLVEVTAVDQDQGVEIHNHLTL